MSESEVEKLARSINQERDRESNGCGALMIFVIIVATVVWFWIKAHVALILFIGALICLWFAVITTRNETKKAGEKRTKAEANRIADRLVAWNLGMKAITEQVAERLYDEATVVFASDLNVSCSNGHKYLLSDFKNESRAGCPLCHTSLFTVEKEFEQYEMCVDVERSRRFQLTHPIAVNPTMAIPTSHWYNASHFKRCPICFWEFDHSDLVPNNLRWNMEYFTKRPVAQKARKGVQSNGSRSTTPRAIDDE